MVCGDVRCGGVLGDGVFCSGAFLIREIVDLRQNLTDYSEYP